MVENVRKYSKYVTWFVMASALIGCNCGCGEVSSEPDDADAGPPNHPPDADVAPPDAAGDDAGWTHTTYDLKHDWSDTDNPDGVWRLKEGGTVIPAPVDEWGGSSERAWARVASGNGFIPAFLRMTSRDLGTDQLEIGDLVIHTRDDGNGLGYGEARVVWTSPAAGTIDVAGTIWLGRTTLGRSNNWTLSVAGMQVASGTITSSDWRGRTNPWSFAERAEEPLTGIPVSAGTEVVLEITKTEASPAGEFTGYTFAVTLAHP